MSLLMSATWREARDKRQYGSVIQEQSANLRE